MGKQLRNGAGKGAAYKEVDVKDGERLLGLLNLTVMSHLQDVKGR